MTSTYTARHLASGEEHSRPAIFVNDNHKTRRQWQARDGVNLAAVETFHRSLPDYNQTELHPLPAVASELGLARVFLKDESTRFALPAFKILGASWAIHRAICQRLGLPAASSLDHVRRAIASAASTGTVLKLVTSTEGNWGRACARMSKVLGLSVTVYVPGFMSEYTRELLRGEGAHVKVLDGASYDDTITATRDDASTTGALMIMDVSWDGYEEIPSWVTQGYMTMLTETSRQIASLTDLQPNTFFVSVGVGSWAHAVVDYCGSISQTHRVICVEPTVAASFKESLHCGDITPIETGDTIMAGMNCGTTSKIAWPVLRDGVHAAMAVDDLEAHESVEYLKGQGVYAGPCGAATLAALKKWVKECGASEDEKRNMVVVLFSTEGARKYDIPH